MSVKLLTEHHFRFLSFKGGCTGSSESKLVKMPHCWKSHVTAHLYFQRVQLIFQFFCYSSLPLFHSAMGWSVVCDCGISWSYSHAFYMGFNTRSLTLAITLMYCNRLHAWWSAQSWLATLLSSLIAHRCVRLQTL